MERLLDKASPGLPAINRNAELRYHLLNALPEKVALQLKLLPKVDYPETISKARELLLLFHQVDTPTIAVSQVQPRSSEDRLRGVEEALQQVSQQLASLSVRRDNVADSRCFKCGQPGHLARNCRSSAMSQIECFRCGQKGHIARNCRNQLNRQGDPHPR